MTAALEADFVHALPDGFVVDVRGLRAGGDGGPVTALIGPSGAGKTTVLRCLAGLARPVRGRIRCAEAIWFDGETGAFVAAQHRGVGLAFQDHALFPHLTVAGNVGYGLRRLPAAERRARTDEWLQRFGIGGLAGRRPRELSGGQQQRVALARALAPRPRLLLLDEPLGSLDPSLRHRLRVELRRAIADVDVPTVLVTHDRAEAVALGDRVAVIDDGNVLQVGAAADVFGRPADLRVAAIVGTDCVVEARVAAVHDGIARLAVGGSELVAPAVPELGRRAFACIRAEDVLLQRERPGASSARNRLLGRVAELVPEGNLLRVRIDCGFELAAMVTRSAADELGLSPGTEVWCLIKATAIHVMPAAGDRGADTA